MDLFSVKEFLKKRQKKKKQKKNWWKMERKVFFSNRLLLYSLSNMKGVGRVQLLIRDSHGGLGNTMLLGWSNMHFEIKTKQTNTSSSYLRILRMNLVCLFFITEYIYSLVNKRKIKQSLRLWQNWRFIETKPIYWFGIKPFQFQLNSRLQIVLIIIRWMKYVSVIAICNFLIHNHSLLSRINYIAILTLRSDCLTCSCLDINVLLLTSILR